MEFILNHPERVREGLRRRGEALPLDDILRLSEQRGGLATRRDGLYSALKKTKETLNSSSDDQKAHINKQIKVTTGEIRQLEVTMTDIDSRLQMMLQLLPNLPQEDVPEGTRDKELRRWGEPLVFQFTPQAHWDLGVRLNLLDFEAGTRIAGSRFVVQKGLGARLERALLSFMLDLHTHEHGYLEVMPPFLARRSIMVGAGQLPKFEEQVYCSSEDELYLNPTAEVPLVGLHSDEILAAHTLPLRYVAWTTAFRREAGSSSRQTRGLLRLHQFNKVELFQIVTPQNAAEAFEQIENHAEIVLRRLDLPYRVVNRAAENLPFSASKSHDLEVWMPAQGKYVEISSISTCDTFQARRSQIKYRLENNRTEFVHTLNASGLAVGRTMAAILETYQQADGSVVVPKVLRPFMGTGVLRS